MSSIVEECDMLREAGIGPAPAIRPGWYVRFYLGEGHEDGYWSDVLRAELPDGRLVVRVADDTPGGRRCQAGDVVTLERRLDDACWAPTVAGRQLDLAALERDDAAREAADAVEEC